MKRRSQLVILMTAVMLSAALITKNKYKKFAGHRVSGSIIVTLDFAPHVRCAAACEAARPECRAFNVVKSNQTCIILTSFKYLYENSEFDLYFDRDMYQELRYEKVDQRLMFLPSTGDPGVDWWDYVYSKCRQVWGIPFVPKDQDDWNYIKGVSNSYPGTWIAMSENKGDDTYSWTDYSSAPGSISFTIKDDQGANELVKYTDADGNKHYENYVDCGLIPSTSSSASTDVEIIDCGLDYVGYICEYGIPDPETVAIHP